MFSAVYWLCHRRQQGVSGFSMKKKGPNVIHVKRFGLRCCDILKSEDGNRSVAWCRPE